jgi:hypothetical protein
MIVFALIVLAAIVGGYVYFARRVSKSVPAVTASVPAPVADAPNAALAGEPSEPNPQV